MDELRAMGLDLGFRKTGYSVFNITLQSDLLIEAGTVFADRLKDTGVALTDYAACLANIGLICDLFDRIKPKFVFVEVPTGGGQSARAVRCMALATGSLAGIMKIHSEIECELFLPREVEKAIGIFLTRTEAKALNLSKSKLGAWKKERMKNVVTTEWPDFRGWPKTKAIAEDAYDSAAAFLCGRKQSLLYSKYKQSLAKGLIE